MRQSRCVWAGRYPAATVREGQLAHRGRDPYLQLRVLTQWLPGTDGQEENGTRKGPGMGPDTPLRRRVGEKCRRRTGTTYSQKQSSASICRKPWGCDLLVGASVTLGKSLCQMLVQTNPHALLEMQVRLTKLLPLVHPCRAGSPCLGADLALRQTHLALMPSPAPQPPGSGPRANGLSSRGPFQPTPADTALVTSPESTLLGAHGRLASPAGSDEASQGHMGARTCLQESGWLLAGV